MKLENLKVKLFADGANLESMLEMASKSYISGLTTNPTLMRKAGVTNYSMFAQQVLEHITQKPVSFEVFSDDISEMHTQARKISAWGENVFVKIPITNTKRESTTPLVRELSAEGIKVNVTAIMTKKQISEVALALNPRVKSFVSVFAGRIADTGLDPIDTIIAGLDLLRENANSEIIWASPREFLNIIQANDVGCQVITATQEILNKLFLLGYDLEEYSLETVQMFYNDALASNFHLEK
jgi:transaldolase